MRILLTSVIASLIAFLLWPWINNFFKMLKNRYDNVTDFEHDQTPTETPTETKKETKNDETI